MYKHRQHLLGVFNKEKTARISVQTHENRGHTPRFPHRSFLLLFTAALKQLLQPLTAPENIQICLQAVIGIHAQLAVNMAVMSLYSTHADKQQTGNILDRIALGIVAQDHALRTGQSLRPVDQLGHKAFHLPRQGILGRSLPQTAVKIGRQLVDLPNARRLPVLLLTSGCGKALRDRHGKAAGKCGGQRQHPHKKAEGTQHPAVRALCARLR